MHRLAAGIPECVPGNEQTGIQQEGLPAFSQAKDFHFGIAFGSPHANDPSVWIGALMRRGFVQEWTFELRALGGFTRQCRWHGAAEKSGSVTRASSRQMPVLYCLWKCELRRNALVMCAHALKSSPVERFKRWQLDCNAKRRPKIAEVKHERVSPQIWCW